MDDKTQSDGGLFEELGQRLKAHGLTPTCDSSGMDAFYPSPTLDFEVTDEPQPEPDDGHLQRVRQMRRIHERREPLSCFPVVELGTLPAGSRVVAESKRPSVYKRMLVVVRQRTDFGWPVTECRTETDQMMIATPSERVYVIPADVNLIYNMKGEVEGWGRLLDLRLDIEIPTDPIRRWSGAEGEWPGAKEEHPPAGSVGITWGDGSTTWDLPKQPSAVELEGCSHEALAGLADDGCPQYRAPEVWDCSECKAPFKRIAFGPADTELCEYCAKRLYGVRWREGSRVEAVSLIDQRISKVPKTTCIQDMPGAWATPTAEGDW